MENIKDIFSHLERQEKYLTPYQFDFIKSLKKHYKTKGTLSPRQIEILESIKKYMSVEA